jgi:hypothetical protein
MTKDTLYGGEIKKNQQLSSPNITPPCFLFAGTLHQTVIVHVEPKIAS